jgi:hypothetical protein
MRGWAAACFLLVLVLVGVRLCTGLVFGDDAPVTYLVIKAPGLTMERKATADQPVNRRLVLDEEEPQLVYEKAYLHLMQSAPVLAAVLLAGGVWLIAGRRRGSSTA